MLQPILAVENLTFRYPDGHLALKGISFSVQPGEKVALVGPNGAGKSTLLLHLNGVLRGTSGRIVINGVPISDRTLGQVRAWTGLVFQNPDDQLFSTHVDQDVAFGPLHMGLPDAEVQARVARALEAVGMSGAAHRVSFHLSGGEKKRVAIATVLSMDPKILVLDEPSSGLDPRTRRSLMQLLASFKDQTMLISTHDMRLAQSLCTRTIILDDGQVVADGPSGDLLTNAELMDLHGLETP